MCGSSPLCVFLFVLLTGPKPCTILGEILVRVPNPNLIYARGSGFLVIYMRSEYHELSEFFDSARMHLARSFFYETIVRVLTLNGSMLSFTVLCYLAVALKIPSPLVQPL
jgi:hypothetical protein